MHIFESAVNRRRFNVMKLNQRWFHVGSLRRRINFDYSVPGGLYLKCNNGKKKKKKKKYRVYDISQKIHCYFISAYFNILI